MKKRNYITWYDRLLNKLFNWHSGIIILTVFLLVGFPSGVIDGKLNVRPLLIEVQLPNKSGLHGIDISHHNGDIVWEQVAASNAHRSAIKFCFLKATEGTDMVDHRFEDHWNELKKRKIARGAYHFFNVKSDPIDQARNFIKQVKLESGDLPPVVDFEVGVRGSKRRERLKNNLQTFIALLEKNYGVKPIIYTNKSLYKEYIENEYLDYPIWISQYNTTILEDYNDDHLTFWQYSMKGKVEGINAPVDFNVFLGDEGEFQELLIP